MPGSRPSQEIELMGPMGLGFRVEGLGSRGLGLRV